MPERVLIVNADDFGLSGGVNAGVAKAHEQGIVTSASLMVRGEGAAAAAEYARTHMSLAVGLHVDLGEWEYRDGEWHAVYEVVPPDDEHDARTEVNAQLESFRRLLGREPTHLDSHQHVHQSSVASNVLTSLGAQLGVPVRHFSAGIRYVGDFYGQGGYADTHPEAISVDGLVRLIEALPPGVTELGCHPAALVDIGSVYGAERVTELATLCDPRVREVLDQQGVALRSFADMQAPRDHAGSR
jgi:chitin disaccharide deacetylase